MSSGLLVLFFVTLIIVYLAGAFSFPHAWREAIIRRVRVYRARRRGVRWDEPSPRGAPRLNGRLDRPWQRDWELQRRQREAERPGGQPGLDGWHGTDAPLGAESVDQPAPRPVRYAKRDAPPPGPSPDIEDAVRLLKSNGYVVFKGNPRRKD